jgi:antitoxin (DNA-binding transcriptional repressor) of toxin-antitoxin stability system
LQPRTRGSKTRQGRTLKVIISKLDIRHAEPVAELFRAHSHAGLVLRLAGQLCFPRWLGISRESCKIHDVATATVRDLRTQFPRVKLLVARDGEVVLTDHGKPAFVLRCYIPPARLDSKRVDYYGRLKARQPRPLSTAAVRALDEADRDER